jgi:hypothetical protein
LLSKSCVVVVVAFHELLPSKSCPVVVVGVAFAGCRQRLASFRVAVEELLSRSCVVVVVVAVQELPPPRRGRRSGRVAELVKICNSA